MMCLGIITTYRNRVIVIGMITSQGWGLIGRIHKIIQIDDSLFIANWESDASISSSNHFSVFGDCHSAYHFPISTSNDSCFTPLDLHCSTSLYSCFFQEDEVLQPSLMVMAGPHCLDTTIVYD